MATLVIWRQELQDQIMELEDQLIEEQKTYSGFHDYHPILPSLRLQIAQLKVKIAKKRAELANPLTLEEQLIEQEKSLEGFHPAHYIRGSIETEIKKLKEKIKKNERLN